MTDFSSQFQKVTISYKRIGYNLNVMRQSACLVINQIMVDSFATLFNCTPVDRASDSMNGPDLKLFILVGWDRSFRLLLGPPFFFCFRFSVVLFDGLWISGRLVTHIC